MIRELSRQLHAAGCGGEGVGWMAVGAAAADRLSRGHEHVKTMPEASILLGKTTTSGVLARDGNILLLHLLPFTFFFAPPPPTAPVFRATWVGFFFKC